MSSGADRVWPVDRLYKAGPKSRLEPKETDPPFNILSTAASVSSRLRTIQSRLDDGRKPSHICLAGSDSAEAVRASVILLNSSIFNAFEFIGIIIAKLCFLYNIRAD